jgi:arylsulfatase A-like enzyme
MSDQRCNILFFICHDLGKELGCYGAGIDTPHLDQFARESVCFTQAFTNSPCCSPSRGTIMTGQYAHTNGLMGLVNQGWSMPRQTRTLVDDLGDASYQTVHIGFQHERTHAQWNRYERELAGDCHAEDVVDRAIDFLQTRRDDRPFYLNLGTMETHESRWNIADRADRWDVYEPFLPEHVTVPAWLPDVPVIREEMARLQSCIQFLDRQWGRLMTALAQQGLYRNTLVVFTTDHGISGMRGKSTLYDHGTEIALLMRLPGQVHAGTKVDHLIQSIDLAPTLMQAAGVEPSHAMQGRSFWPLFQDQPYQPHEHIFTEFNEHGVDSYDPMRSVRTQRYHYIRNFSTQSMRQWLPDENDRYMDRVQHWVTEHWPVPNQPCQSYELYDVVTDPHEQHNLAGELEHAPLCNYLDRIVTQWMVDTNDPLLEQEICQHAPTMTERTP